jgi:hypothetical protein
VIGFVVAQQRVNPIDGLWQPGQILAISAGILVFPGPEAVNFWPRSLVREGDFAWSYSNSITVSIVEVLQG